MRTLMIGTGVLSIGYLLLGTKRQGELRGKDSTYSSYGDQQPGLTVEFSDAPAKAPRVFDSNVDTPRTLFAGSSRLFNIAMPCS